MQKVYAVGLGPGDYEMMTLKAKRVLTESDVIFLCGGKVFNGFHEVKAILDIIGCGHKLHFYKYPDNIADREKYLEDFTCQSVKYLNEGKKVSYVTMGDMTIYSSFPDIYKKLAENNIKLEAVTGISSIFAPASLTGNSIVDWQDKAAIIPNVDDYHEIHNLLKTFKTIIILKIIDKGETLKKYLENYKPAFACAVFNAYKENQKIYNLLEEFPEDRDGFIMSVVMIKG